jgi:hypothetical protein
MRSRNIRPHPMLMSTSAQTTPSQRDGFLIGTGQMRPRGVGL